MKKKSGDELKVKVYRQGKLVELTLLLMETDRTINMWITY